MSTYADAIRRQAEDAPRAALPAVTKAMWSAFAAGQITEAEAEALSALIEARGSLHAARAKVCSAQEAAPRRGENADLSGDLRSLDLATSTPDQSALPTIRQSSPRTGAGSRPRSDASLGRRRRWAASGRLPPALAARFTLAELAVLSLVAAETAKRGDCRLSVGHLAAAVGVSESTVRNAIREARKFELVTVEERRLAAWRSDSNIIRIVSPEWTAWLRLSRRSPNPGSGLLLRRERKGGGCKFVNPTSTQVSNQGKTRTAKRPQGRSADPKSPSRTVSRIAGA